MRRLLLAASLACAAAGAARAAEPYTVIVNTGSKLARIPVDDLSRIYLGKKTLWEDTGTRIVPALPDEDGALGRAFLDSALNKSVAQYRAYWKRQLFSGGGTAPKTFRTSEQVIEFVARQPGGIGIIETGALDARAKAVEVTR